MKKYLLSIFIGLSLVQTGILSYISFVDYKTTTNQITDSINLQASAIQSKEKNIAYENTYEQDYSKELIQIEKELSTLISEDFNIDPNTLRAGWLRRILCEMSGGQWISASNWEEYYADFDHEIGGGLPPYAGVDMCVRISDVVIHFPTGDEAGSYDLNANNDLNLKNLKPFSFVDADNIQKTIEPTILKQKIDKIFENNGTPASLSWLFKVFCKMTGGTYIAEQEYGTYGITYSSDACVWEDSYVGF